jgi:hypothetical protein
MAWRRYFGAAKQLPGVRELFEVEAPRAVRRTRHQLYAHINGDYYGFRDEEDGVLEKVEAEAERHVRQKVRFGGESARAVPSLSGILHALCRQCMAAVAPAAGEGANVDAVIIASGQCTGTHLLWIVHAIRAKTCRDGSAWLVKLLWSRSCAIQGFS